MTPLELIWNGWRGQYVAQAGTGRADDGSSVFTQILRCGMPDDDTYVIHRGTAVFVLLNAFPYTSGHSMVVPYRQVPSLEDLDPGETIELWETVTAAVRVVRHAYRPGGVNVGINLGAAAGGSINEHLHVHVLPRWNGDGNFMTAIANARTLPEPLAVSAARLRDAWAEVASTQ